MKSTGKKLTIRSMAMIGMLGALSAVLISLNFPLPLFPPFYRFDVADLPALLGGFMMGPVAGGIIIGVKLLMRMLMMGSDTMFVGELSNLINSLAFVLPATWIYARGKSKKTAMIGLSISTVFAAIVSVLTNAFIALPLYSAAFGWPLESIIGMGTAINAGITDLLTFLLFAVLPFNLLKGGATALVTFAVYKRISVLFDRYMASSPRQKLAPDHK